MLPVISMVGKREKTSANRSPSGWPCFEVVAFTWEIIVTLLCKQTIFSPWPVKQSPSQRQQLHASPALGSPIRNGRIRRFIHLNARSLLPKLDELNVLASKTKAAVIGVSEM